MDILAFIAAPFSASTYPADVQLSLERAFAGSGLKERVATGHEVTRGGSDDLPVRLFPSTASGRS